jgi:aspartyl-tRNA synthetase
MKQAPTPNEYRDHWAGDLTDGATGTTVRVAGWVHRRRDHGGLIFIDLRDISGIVQLVFHPDTSGAGFAIAEALRPEHVLTARGEVVRRDEQNVNPNIATGTIEVSVAEAAALAESETPPFPLDEDVEVDELLRLRHRYLDLRRDSMQRTMQLRARTISTMRRELEARDFLEIETPILGKSTPEGARDFLVPNRREAGTWYALPQSPQLYKELLMFSGYERYYQIARCFRDEDLRADRQPEFTQLDVEMAFVNEDDVIGTMEAVMSEVLALGDLGLPPTPWERIPYAEAMERYGSDRPDRRFGLELVDVSDAVQGVEFKVFASVLESGGAVIGLNAGRLELSRSDLDGLNAVAQRHGGKAVAWAFAEEGGTWRSPIGKFFGEEQIAAVSSALGAAPGDLLLFAADQRHVAQGALGGLRLELADRYGLRSDTHDIFWIVDFPMVEWNEDEQRWDALHHPFTAPAGDLDGDPSALLSRAYDLVMDGTELGGGSIRINRPEEQLKILEILGMDLDEAQESFGFLLDAMKYGAPPLGGIAFGLDRVVALMAGTDSIRDVIAFPKTASGADPMSGAPSRVDPRQMRELGVRLA